MGFDSDVDNLDNKNNSWAELRWKYWICIFRNM